MFSTFDDDIRRHDTSLLGMYVGYVTHRRDPARSTARSPRSPSPHPCLRLLPHPARPR